MVRELGLKRRETVWSLSTVGIETKKDFFLVREDRNEDLHSVSIVKIIYFSTVEKPQIFGIIAESI